MPLKQLEVKMENWAILRETVCVFVLLTSIFGLINGQVESTETRPLNCSDKLIDGKLHVSCVGYPAIPTDLYSKYQLSERQVHTLDMSSGNHLQIIKEEEFTNVGLHNLQKVILSNNNIRTIERGAFRDLNLLTELDLSFNKIDFLDMEMFEENNQLQILKFHANPIHQLKGSMFPTLPSLKRLDLSNCQIQKIPKDSFCNLANLERVDLDGNQLKRLDWDVFETVHKLSYLTLKDNPWHCDCHVKFLREYLSEKKIPTSSQLCAGPEKMTNRSWNSIETNDLTCHPKIVNLTIISHDLDESAFVDDGIVYSEIGKDIAFECSIEAYPAPEVTWFKNKDVISEIIARDLDSGDGNDSRITIERPQNKLFDQKSEFIYIYSNLLRIYKAEVGDLGSYSCEVKNLVGFEIKSIYLNFTNFPLQDDTTKTGGSKTWLWIVIMLIVLILIAALILCFGMWKRRERKKQKFLKKQMMEKFKDSQIILDDLDMQPRKIQQTSNVSEGASAPLLPPENINRSKIQTLQLRQIPDVAAGNPEYVRSLSPEVFSPRPPSTADMKRHFFALRQMSEPPITSSRPGSAMSTSNVNDHQGRRFQFAQKPYPGSADQADVYYSARRPTSSLSLAYPDPSYHPQQRPQFTRQYSGPALPPSYATMRFPRDRRTPSVTSYASEPAHDNSFRPGFGYVTLPRGFAPPRVDSGFGRSLSPTESTYSSFSYSTLPRRGRDDPNTGVVYDAVGPRTSVDGGSNLSLNRIGESRPINGLDSINQGLFSPTRGKVKSARNRIGSANTPGSLRGRNDFFSFEPIQEVEGSDDVLAKLASNNDIDNLLPKIHSLPRTNENRFAKKKAPIITNIPPKSRKPIRTFEYSKYPDNPNPRNTASDNHTQAITGNHPVAAEESSVDDPYELNVDDIQTKSPPRLPPHPPPKPHRLQSSIENIFDLQIQPTIMEEVPGTEV